MKKKVLLLSGYDAASHRYWRLLLERLIPQLDWVHVALPDRHFYWRVRGNGLTYAYSHGDTLCQHYDLIIATSMVDLCNLRGFLPALGLVPTVVYFHENQFDYPTRQPANNLINAQLTSVYSALCADRLMFNSDYNRASFFSGAGRLLKKMPDGVERGLLQPLASRAEVLPVPLHPLPGPGYKSRKPVSADTPVEIVWNHRWEYDKQPEVFFAVMCALKKAGVRLKLHVVGQSFRQVPDCFDEARLTLGNEIVSWGYQSEESYFAILDSAHIVMSTALHDFQGLSMLQAIQRGCIPIAPKRVAYPEYIPETLLYDIDGDEVQGAVTKLLQVLAADLPQPPDVTRFDSCSLLPRYNRVFSDLMAPA